MDISAAKSCGSNATDAVHYDLMVMGPYGLKI